MKKLIVVFLLLSLTSYLKAQTYTYEVKMDNFQQVNETEFQFDVNIRKGTGSSDFALYAMQCRWSYNSALVNGGTFHTDYLTLVGGSTPTGTQLYQKAGWFSDNDFTRISSTQLGWATVSIILGNGDQITVIDDTWRKVARFSAKLRNSDNTAMHNFADVDAQFAFETSGINLIVRRCDGYTGSNPTATMVGNGNSEVLPAGRVVTPALGVAVNARKLAGYYFTGTGNWSETARWNNITTANANTLPGASNNAIIAGSATTTDTRTVKDLTVASGGYLLISTAAQLTADNVYNDNTGGGGGSGVVTLANWNFQSATVGTTIPTPYLADAGISANINIAPFQVGSPATLGFYFNFSASGGTIATRATTWYDELEDVWGYWKVSLSSAGFQNLKLSSKQYSVASGPKSFKIQYSLNGTSWTDVSGGAVTVSNNWTTGVINNLTLPSALDNLSIIYLRWQATETNVSNFSTSAIDDIVITGEYMPTGMLIKSTIDGTGSLIQSSTGVNATMERYIAGADWGVWNDGWHFLSSPVAAQAVAPVFNTEPYDFYSWYEPLNEWVNYKNTSGTPWATANTINNELSNNTANFLVGKGYMAAYDEDQTKSFTGELNVANVNITGLPITGSTGTNRSWHLLGNPFSSALTWSDSWTKTNIAGTAKIWKEINQSYSDLASSGAAIPATNGFMVQVNAAPGSITIPATARVHSSQAFYKSSDQKMMLTARNLDFPSAQESVIENNPNSTTGFDLEYDGEFLTGYAPLFFSESENVHLSTNSLPLITSTTEIPFTFVKNEGTNFSIEAVGASTLAPEVWLMDKKTNIDHNLLLNPVYNFTATSSDDPNRFVLHFGTVSVVDIKANPDFTVWYNDGRICFSSVPANIQKLTLIDMAGRELVNVSNPESKDVWIGSNFAKACYLVKITTQDAVVAKKIVIN